MVEFWEFGAWYLEFGALASEFNLFNHNNLRSPGKQFIQNPAAECLSIENVNNGQPSGWCEKLYEAKASELILYGRALGLSHSEAEDVLQETFIALRRAPEPPKLPDHY